MVLRPVRPIKPNRYLKIASAKNPTNDFIELNDFEGFLCTGFQSLGISRKFDFLTIKNRQFVVDNKPSFKKYSLKIEILTKYSEYEQKYRELITFLDRNKKGGFRLYFRPYEGMELRYCLCDIETSVRNEKMQPVVLTLVQNSLWLGEEKISTTVQFVEEADNLFSFYDDGDGYNSAKFLFDEETNEYCIEFFNGITAIANIKNDGYNDIPLNIKIYGPCVNPFVSLFKLGENESIRKVKIYANVSEDHYIFINANIAENGVWYVDRNTKEKIPYDDAVDSENSPYFHIENGEYVIRVVDDGNNVCITDVTYQEEYSE